MLKTKGLGRGLDALLGPREPAPATGEAVISVDVDRVQPGRYQPRTRMDDAALAELAESIRRQGIIQPILLRAIPGERYEIIAGERRWRASRLAGLAQVPAIVREIPDESALAIALIENIQREELNPLEEAAGLKRLIDEFHMTHQAAAEAVGRSRSAVTNLLRLLGLAPPVQEMMMRGALDMGHARALLPLPAARQAELAALVAERNLSVREAEHLANKAAQSPATKKPRKIDRDTADLEERLAEKLGARVSIQQRSKGAGRLVIEYASLEQLDGILSRLP